MTDLRVRTYATSTYWFGSRFPPCSMALSNISRKPVATSSLSGAGRSDTSWKNWTNLSAVFLSQRAMMLIHSGVAETSSMPSSQKGSVVAQRTISHRRDHVCRCTCVREDDETNMRTDPADFPQ